MDAPPIQYLTVAPGVSIAYCVSGEGPPLVYMPELFSELRLMWNDPIFRSQYEPLSARFRLVQYDQRGQGLSSRGLPEAPSVTELAHDLEALVDHLKLDSFMLYGFAASGPPAIAYAVKHPERVRGLALQNISTQWPPQLKAFMATADHSWEFFLTHFANSTFGHEAPESAIARMRASMTYEDLVKSHHRPDPFVEVTPLLPLLRVPTQVIVRSAGAGMPLLEDGRRVTSLIPGASLVFQDGIAGGRYSTDGSIPPLVTTLENFDRHLASSAPTPTPDSENSGLSVRELEVLRLLAAGKSNPQIAEALVISVNTVGRHVSNIFDKTGVANRVEAAAYARDNGLL